MVNIIGLTKRSDGQKVMVNTDHILYFQADPSGEQTEVVLTGGVFLYVVEDMYEIVERTEPEPDCFWDADVEEAYQAAVARGEGTLPTLRKEN